jgi:Tol biopolymer transport system component
MKSSLEIHDIASGQNRVVHVSEAHIEAPNWSRDGGHLLFNGDGRLWRIPVSGGEPELIDTGFATQQNNDHGLSPDGKTLAISDKSETGKSCIYVLPAGGGTPRRVTANVPSWWHGWSPDGARLTYPAVRDGRFGIYTIPVEGGAETMVTGGDGAHYDGPDYTADGEWIWFNSDRSGVMQLWRVREDGSGLEQMTGDQNVNWFPHPSPDGQKVVYLAYEPGTEGHPAGKHVELRLIAPGGGEPRTVVRLFGGQGTINVPSWSPDGRAFAFMRYFGD